MSGLKSFGFALIPVFMAAFVLPAGAQTPATCECPSAVFSGQMSMDGTLPQTAQRKLNECVTETDFTGTMECAVRSACSPQGAAPERCTAEVSLTFTTMTFTCSDGSPRTSEMCRGTVKFTNAPRSLPFSSCALNGIVDASGSFTACLSSSSSSTSPNLRDQATGMATGKRTHKPLSVTVSSKHEFTGHVTLMK